MNTIQVLCLGCNTSFEFRHPAVPTASELHQLTISCPNCNERITGAVTHIVMAPTGMPELAPVTDNPKQITHSYSTGEKLPEPPQRKTHLPQSPLAHNDELAALRNRLANKEQ